MNPKTFIFIGCSGCGKGTQAKLLATLANINKMRFVGKVFCGIILYYGYK